MRKYRTKSKRLRYIDQSIKMELASRRIFGECSMQFVEEEKKKDILLHMTIHTFGVCYL